VHTRQLRFRSAHEVILKNCYQVLPDDLGWLLLTLARALCPLAQPAPPHAALSTPQSASPDVAPDEGGWITVSLTRLDFPLECCACGIPTTCTNEFHAMHGFERDGIGVSIPVCEDCQQQFRRRYWKALGKLALVLWLTGSCVGFLIGAMIALVDRVGDLFPALAIFLAIPVGMSGPLFVPLLRGWANKWASPP